jgi:Phage capsid protein
MAEPYTQGLYPLFTTQFSTILELKLQQMGSLLRGRVDERAYVGKMASPVQQLNATVAKQPAGLYAPLDLSDNGFTRRWVFPTERELGQLIDTFQELETIVDPKSQYSTNAAMAFGRAIDDIIFQAAFGTNQTGQDAASLSPETFNTALTTAGSPGFQIGIQFGSTVNTGLTIDKLVELRRNLRHYHVDIERDPVTLVIGSQQEADLLNQVKVTSSEFNTAGGVLVDGKVTRFMGFDLCVSERLPYVTGTSTRQCLAFAKSGMHLGVWKDLYNRIDIRIDKSSQPYQLYTQMMIGATRTQPGKVWMVSCLDTTGGDITP